MRRRTCARAPVLSGPAGQDVGLRRAERAAGADVGSRRQRPCRLRHRSRISNSGWTATVDGSTSTWRGGCCAHLDIATFRLDVDVSAPPGTAALETLLLYPSGAEVGWPATLLSFRGRTTEGRWVSGGARSPRSSAPASSSPPRRHCRAASSASKVREQLARPARGGGYAITASFLRTGSETAAQARGSARRRRNLPLPPGCACSRGVAPRPKPWAWPPSQTTPPRAPAELTSPPPRHRRSRSGRLVRGRRHRQRSDVAAPPSELTALCGSSLPLVRTDARC